LLAGCDIVIYRGYIADDQERGPNLLLRDAASGETELLPVRDLGDLLLKSEFSPGLLVLATGRPEGDPPSLQAAQELSQVVPAVLALPRLMAGHRFNAFVAAFFAELIATGNVEQATIKGRRDIFSARHEDWAVPVLYSAAEMGNVFTPGERVEPAAQPTPAQTTQPDAGDAEPVALSSELQLQFEQPVEPLQLWQALAERFKPGQEHPYFTLQEREDHVYDVNLYLGEAPFLDYYNGWFKLFDVREPEYAGFDGFLQSDQDELGLQGRVRLLPSESETGPATQLAIELEFTVRGEPAQVGREELDPAVSRLVAQVLEPAFTLAETTGDEGADDLPGLEGTINWRRTLAAPRAAVEAALRDLPGLARELADRVKVEPRGDDAYALVIDLATAPFEGTYEGTVKLGQRESRNLVPIVVDLAGESGSLRGWVEPTLRSQRQRSSLRLEGEYHVDGTLADAGNAAIEAGFADLFELAATVIEERAAAATEAPVEQQTQIAQPDPPESAPAQGRPGATPAERPAPVGPPPPGTAPSVSSPVEVVVQLSPAAQALEERFRPPDPVLRLEVYQNSVRLRFDQQTFSGPNRLDPAALRELWPQLPDYGRRLFAGVIHADPSDGAAAGSATHDGYYQMMRNSGGQLRFELELDPNTIGLDEYRWEYLQPPGDPRPLAAREQAPFVRRVPVLPQARSAPTPGARSLKILAAIAAPTNLGPQQPDGVRIECFAGPTGADRSRDRTRHPGRTDRAAATRSGGVGRVSDSRSRPRFGADAQCAARGGGAGLHGLASGLSWAIRRGRLLPAAGTERRHGRFCECR
jgi:carbon monoxide dehydrogenase subunit G